MPNMKVKLSKNFQKQYRKAPRKIQKSVKSRIILFRNNPSDSLLNNHALVGKLKGYRSINITGDWRAIYREIGINIAYFVSLGTHSQLYG